MRKPKKMDRRDFVKASAEFMSLFGALSTGIQIMPKLAGAATKCDLTSAASNLPHRKYLISIECSGGIDNHYLANALDQSQFTGYADRYNKFSEGASRTISHVDHPLHKGVHFIGPALLAADHNEFKLQDLLSDVCVLKGVEKEGEHTFGNRIIANGGTSVYNAGFCSLVADACSKVKEKPFQHVALGQMGYNQVGMLKGGAVPMLVSGMESFLGSVSDLSKDPEGLERKSFVKQIVKELYADVAQKTLAKCESQRMYSDFGKFFEQMIGIREKPLLYSDATVDWNEIWSWWNDYMNFQSNNHPMAYAILRDNSGNQIRHFNNVAGPFAFYGALTEFLIRRDLTSVVNFGYQSGDHHGTNSASPGGYLADGQKSAAVGSLYMGLIHRLKKAKTESGKSLLDHTLIAVTSEFDRTAYHDGLGGTDHSGYHSILMAGAGNRGVIGGQIMAKGPYAGYKGKDGTTAQYGCLSMKPDGTPSPDGGGIGLTVSAILPLVLKIMGIGLPPQQITEQAQKVEQMTWYKKIA